MASPSVAASLDLRYVLSHLDRRGGLPVEAMPARAALPAGIGLDGLRLPAARPARSRREARPGPALRLALASRRDLAGLMGVSARRVSQLVARLEEFGLVSHSDGRGSRRLALTDRGLGLLARRDRTSVGTARRRWSVAPIDPLAPLTWRNVSGSRSRQLLCNVEHTGAVHWFLVALAAQACAAGWEVVQLDPPRRASRYFRHEGRLHSALPDAFGMLRRGNDTLPFLLEWARRAVRPVTMAARPGPLPALLLLPPSPGRPRRCAPRPGGLRRRTGRHPLPAGGPGGDGAGRGGGPLVGVPQGGVGTAGAAGSSLAHAPRLGTGLRFPEVN